MSESKDLSAGSTWDAVVNARRADIDLTGAHQQGQDGGGLWPAWLLGPLRIHKSVCNCHSTYTRPLEPAAVRWRGTPTLTGLCPSLKEGRLWEATQHRQGGFQLLSLQVSGQMGSIQGTQKRHSLFPNKKQAISKGCFSVSAPFNWAPPLLLPTCLSGSRHTTETPL